MKSKAKNLFYDKEEIPKNLFGLEYQKEIKKENLFRIELLIIKKNRMYICTLSMHSVFHTRGFLFNLRTFEVDNCLR